MSEKKLDGLPHGIKELVTYDVQSSWRMIGWILAGAIVLLILFLLWRYLKNRKRKDARLPSPLEQLNALKVDEDFDSADPIVQRNLYERMSRLFKSHLLLVTRINLEDKTVSEIKKVLSSPAPLGAPGDLALFQKIMERGDLIKFGGATVARSTAEEDLRSLVNIANELQKSTEAERNDFR